MTSSLPANSVEAKRCGKCGSEKSRSDFNRDRSARDGLKRWCRDCTRSATRHWTKSNPEKNAAKSRRRRRLDPEREFERGLRRWYGLSRSDYDALLAKQNGVCAICKQPESSVRNGVVQRLSVDHCHLTGEVRGLLCLRCNRALGCMADDAERLRAAADYLEWGRS